MAQDQEDMTRRPERVVIVDADDPMREIEGDFVWLDEHERVLSEARQSAFAEGYDAGVQASRADTRVVVRRRRTLSQWAWLAALVLVVLVVLLMLPVVLT